MITIKLLLATVLSQVLDWKIISVRRIGMEP